MLQHTSPALWKQVQELTLENAGVQPNLATLAKSAFDKQKRKAGAQRTPETKPKRTAKRQRTTKADPPGAT